MEKKNIYILIIVLAIIGVGTGFGIYYGIILSQPSEEEEEILEFFGTGVTGNFSMTMSKLNSSKYTQVVNQLYFGRKSIDKVENGTYSGVSLRSILEVEDFYVGGAENFTAIGEGWYIKGPLNLSIVMENDPTLCIIAYGGTDFDPEYDGSLRLIMNQSIVEPDFPLKSYWMKDLIKIFMS